MSVLSDLYLNFSGNSPFFQELLLSVPGFLGKLLTFACDRKYMNQTTSWVDFLDVVMEEEIMRISSRD